MSEVMTAALLLLTIPLSCIALLISCVAISIVVGLKNSTHNIVWKETQPFDKQPEDTPGDSEDENDEPMLNPNKRRKKDAPFTPFPTEEEKEPDPFFDEDDPNNTAHDLG